jgi:hypothetical protein
VPEPRKTAISPSSGLRIIACRAARRRIVARSGGAENLCNRVPDQLEQRSTAQFGAGIVDARSSVVLEHTMVPSQDLTWKLPE